MPCKLRTGAIYHGPRSLHGIRGCEATAGELQSIAQEIMIVKTKIDGIEREIDLGEFVECETCAAKPGSPPLCPSCLKNRETIGVLRGAVKRSLAVLETLRSSILIEGVLGPTRL